MTKYLKKSIWLFTLITIFQFIQGGSIFGQQAYRIHERGMLHETVYNTGEIGRKWQTGQAGNVTDLPVFEWPPYSKTVVGGVEYSGQHNIIGAGLYIGANEAGNPGEVNRLFALCGGVGASMPEESYGRWSFPLSIEKIENYPVLADGTLNPDYNPDEAEEIIIAEWATSVGITVKRTSRAWSYPDYDDMIIYEYELRYSGDLDGNPATVEQTVDLKDVMVALNYGFAPSMYGYQREYQTWKYEGGIYRGDQNNFWDSDWWLTFNMNLRNNLTDASGAGKPEPDPDLFLEFAQTGKNGGALGSPQAPGYAVLYYDTEHLAYVVPEPLDSLGLNDSETQAVLRTSTLYNLGDYDDVDIYHDNDNGSFTWYYEVDENHHIKQPWSNKVSTGNTNSSKMMYEKNAFNPTTRWSGVYAPGSVGWPELKGEHWIGRAAFPYRQCADAGMKHHTFGPYSMSLGDKIEFSYAEVVGYGAEPGKRIEGGQVITQWAATPSWNRSYIIDDQLMTNAYIDDFGYPDYVNSDVVNVTQVTEKAFEAYLGESPTLPVWPEDNPQDGVYSIPTPYPAPVFQMESTGSDGILLSWGQDVESFTHPRTSGIHQEYRIYSAESKMGPWNLNEVFISGSVNSQGKYEYQTSDSDNSFWTITSVSSEGQESGKTWILSPKMMEFVNPVGSESWGVGDVVSIQWRTIGAELIDLDLTFDGGDSWVPIAHNLDPSTGSHEWTTPDTVVLACVLRIQDVSDSTNQSMSRPFSLVGNGIAPAPIQILPNDGVENQLTSQYFSWNPAPLGETYCLQISEHADFSLMLVDTSGLLQTYWSNPFEINPELNSVFKPARTYFWRVRADNRVGSSEYSEVRSFSTFSSSTLEVRYANAATFSEIINFTQENDIETLVLTSASSFYVRDDTLLITHPLTIKGTWNKYNSDDISITAQDGLVVSFNRSRIYLTGRSYIAVEADLMIENCIVHSRYSNFDYAIQIEPNDNRTDVNLTLKNSAVLDVVLLHYTWPPEEPTGHAIVTATGANVGVVEIENCSFYNIASEAVMLGSIDENGVGVPGSASLNGDINFNNCTFDSVSAECIRVVGDPDDLNPGKIQIEHLTVYNSSPSTILIEETHADVNITNSIIANTFSVDPDSFVIQLPSGSSEIANVDFFGMGIPQGEGAQFVSASTVSNIYELDPGFANPETGDFTIDETSGLFTLASDGYSLGDLRWAQFNGQGDPRISTVYPGDTDNDGDVDAEDVLPLGVFFLEAGEPRTDASLGWESQEGQSWIGYPANYADANGDGVVNERDLIPLGLNWGLTHNESLLRFNIDPLAIAGDESLKPAFEKLYKSVSNLSGTPAHALKQMLERVLLINIPLSFSLDQNYPNPFNSQTKIKYTLPESQAVRLSVFNIRGQLVTEERYDQPQAAGRYTYTFNGSGHSSGLYFLQIRTPKFQGTKKMLLIK